MFACTRWQSVCSHTISIIYNNIHAIDKSAKGAAGRSGFLNKYKGVVSRPQLLEQQEAEGTIASDPTVDTYISVHVITYIQHPHALTPWIIKRLPAYIGIFTSKAEMRN